MEHNAQFWYPQFRKDVYELDMVQRRATIMIKRSENMSYRKILKKPNLLGLTISKLIDYFRGREKWELRALPSYRQKYIKKLKLGNFRLDILFFPPQSYSFTVWLLRKLLIILADRICPDFLSMPWLLFKWKKNTINHCLLEHNKLHKGNTPYSLAHLSLGSLKLSICVQKGKTFPHFTGSWCRQLELLKMAKETKCLSSCCFITFQPFCKVTLQSRQPLLWQTCYL